MTQNSKNGFIGMAMQPIEKPKFLVVAERGGRVIVDVRGEFPLDEGDISNEIIKIREMSSKYSIVEVHLRSPGGSVDAMVELIEVLRGYEFIHTFGYGSIASAAALTWSIGDVRVLAKYTSVMYHRESFGVYGKVPQQQNVIDHYNRLYGELLKDVAGDILTEEEMNSARSGDVYLSESDLIERGASISYEQYYERDSLSQSAQGIIDVNGIKFLAQGNSLVRILDMTLDTENPISFMPDVYWMEVVEPNDQILQEGQTEEESLNG